MQPIFLILIAVAALLVVASGVWVAVALLRAVSGRARLPETERDENANDARQSQ
jgi:hypothetical protein